MSILQPKTVLLVDDELPPRRELRIGFEQASCNGFAFQVFEANSVEKYHEVVSETHFDVMIVDLRLLAGEEGTYQVIMPHMIYSPGTIIIVYSAFPELDPVPSVVKAMRAGAVDCIVKGADNSVHAVVESACRELRAQETPEWGPRSSWLEEHLDELIAQHGGQAVAFVGQDVVAAAPTVGELRKHLQGMNLTGSPFLMVVPSREGRP